MKNKISLITLFITCLIFITSFSVIAVPKHFNYQGRLTDNQGNAFDGNYQMRFNIFNSENGGESLWNEQKSVTLTEGIYNIQLGVDTPFPIDLFDNDDLYLEVTIYNPDLSSWETLSSRLHLSSGPFAMKAGDAETLEGMIASDFAGSAELATHADNKDAHHSKTTGFSELTDTATDAQIPDNITIDKATSASNADTVDGKHASYFIGKGEDSFVTSNMIVDGTIGSDDLANDSITSAKIQNGTIKHEDLSFKLKNNEYIIEDKEIDQATIDVIGTNKKATVIFPHNSTNDSTTYTFITDVVIPSNIAVIMEHGAILDGGITLTINGPFKAGLSQCFEKLITIKFGSQSISIVYPEWFGVDNTDGSDTSETFQNALTAASGIILKLKPSAIYRINSELDIPSRTKITCQGRATIKSTGTSFNDIFTLSSDNNVIIENIDFNLVNDPNGLGSSTAIESTDSDNLNIRNCTVTNGAYGFHIKGGNDIRIENCTIANTYYFCIILTNTINRAWITTNHTYGSYGYDGIKVAGVKDGSAPKHKNIYISENVSHDNNRDGIDVAVNEGEHIFVKKNVCYSNNLMGIEFKLISNDPVKLSNSIISENIIYLTSNNPGIAIENSGTNPNNVRDIILRNNIVYGQGIDKTIGSAYKLITVRRVSFIGNHAYNCYRGFRALGACECVIKNNIFSTVEIALFFATDGTQGCTDNLIAENEARNIHSYFIKSDSYTTRTQMYNNTVHAPEDILDGSNWTFGPGLGTIAKTENYNCEESESGTYYCNTGATSIIAFNLPKGRCGLTYGFIRSGSQQININPYGNEVIRGGGAGKQIYLDDVGDTIILKCANSDPNSVVWEIIGGYGTYSYE